MINMIISVVSLVPKEKEFDFIGFVIKGVRYLVFGDLDSKVSFLDWLFKWEGGLGWFAGVSISLLMFFFLIEVIKSAIKLMRGEGFDLDKKIYVLVMISVMIVAYRPISKAIWDGSTEISKLIIESYKNITKSVDLLWESLDKAVRAEARVKLDKVTWSHGISADKAALKAYYGSVSAPVARFVTPIILAIEKGVICIIVGGVFVSLGMVLMVGPFFLPWFLFGEFKNITIQWFTNVLIYFLELLIMVFLIKLANYITLEGIRFYVNLSIFKILSYKFIFISLVFPGFTIGLLISASRLARTMFSSIVGGSEDTVIGTSVASVGIGIKLAETLMSGLIRIAK